MRWVLGAFKGILNGTDLDKGLTPSRAGLEKLDFGNEIFIGAGTTKQTKDYYLGL